MSNLLYLVAIILLIGWVFGFFVFSLGGFIHTLLVFAVIAILFRLIGGRGVWPMSIPQAIGQQHEVVWTTSFADYSSSSLTNFIIQHMPIVEKNNFSNIATSLIILIALGFLLFIGKEIITPLLFSVLIASLLLPIVQFFQHRGLGKSISILIPVLFTLILLLSTLYFFHLKFQVFYKTMRF